MNIQSVFYHYWKFLKKRIFSQALLLIGYAFATIGTTVVIPLLYKEIVDTVSRPPNEVSERLIMLVIFLAIATFFYNVFFRISDYFLIKSQSQIIKELQDYSLEKLKKHSYTFFSNAFVGGLVTKTKRFIHAFEVLHDQFIFHVWMSGIALLCSLIVLWREAPILGLVFLIWLLVYSFLVRLMVKWQIPKSLISAEADTKSTSRYADIVTNILTVKMFGSELRELNDYKKTTKEQERKRTAAWMQQNFWNGMFQGAIIGIFNVIMIWFVVDLWIKGVVSAGTIVLVQVYVLTSFNIVWSISRSVIRAFSALTDADEMVKLFDQSPSVKDLPKTKKLEIKEGRIEFKDVTFSYEDSSEVFKDFNLKINPGEKVALVGHSGSGKTTIVKLILRFIDIQKGKIEIDGQDISTVSQGDLRNQIAYVPQDPSLFHRSLRENISYANPKAPFFEIVKVAKKAHAHEFIKNLPDSYDSLVGERGIKLSGGERQRVAIARAMLKNSPIIVLDEATSSLDSLAEEKIQKALQELIKGKTTIVIAHRLSTIREMDRIIVFDNGRIAEEGNHKELLRKKGIYSNLWKSQVGGFLIE